MKFVTLMRSTLLALAFIGAQAQAGVAVIVHPSNADALNPDVISQIFLGKQKAFPSGGDAVPIDLAEGSATKSAFVSSMLNKNDSQIKAYWAKVLFTGKGTPPKEVANDAAVIDLISKNPSLIGYIDSASVNDSVKVVHQF